MCLGREKKRGEHYQAHRVAVTWQGKGVCRQRDGTLSKIGEPRDVLCETWATLLSSRGRRYGVRELAGKASAGEASLNGGKRT